MKKKVKDLHKKANGQVDPNFDFETYPEIIHTPNAVLRDCGDFYMGLVFFTKGENPYDSVFSDVKKIKTYVAEKYDELRHKDLPCAFESNEQLLRCGYSSIHDFADDYETDEIEEIINNILTNKKHECITCRKQVH